MTYYQKQENVREKMSGNGHSSFPMLDSRQGCTNGCCCGISLYRSTEYTPAASHEEQEGFLVLSGRGWAKIGQEEFELSPRMAFIAPRETRHQMRSSSEDEPLELFWFHANG